MAAALLHHEPGWRLPRHTALARRYNVTIAEIDAAVNLLAQRHLLTRLPDGQVFRASPAEYRLTLEGLPGLATHVDPMGGQLACKSRNVARRRAAEDVARVLGTPPGNDLLTVRCLWTVGGEPAAYSASYLPPQLEGLANEQADVSSAIGFTPPYSRPRAFQFDFQAPAPSVARSLRLSAGAPGRYRHRPLRGQHAPRSAGADGGRAAARTVPHRGGVPRYSSPHGRPGRPAGRLDRRSGGLGALTAEARPDPVPSRRETRANSGGSDSWWNIVRNSSAN